jgi:threonine synthase
MRGVVFIPDNLEYGKFIGAAIYGCTIVAVDGSYDDVNRLCSEIADNYRWAFVNVNMRPYYAEGSKTLGYETIEQLGWRLPDHTIVPAASGELYTKIWRGFNEMVEMELLDGPVHTRMHLTQPQGCSPIVEAAQKNATQVKPIKPNTLARSLAIGNPAAGLYALKVIAESQGTSTAVPEEEIAEGIKLLAETEGIFTETAGGVVISGLKQLVRQGVIQKDDTTVAFITGNGLKTQEAVEGVVQPLKIKPMFSEFEQAFNEVAVLQN